MGSTAPPQTHPVTQLHRRLSATHGRVDLEAEPFWIEPGPAAGIYVLGGELDMASAEQLAKLNPPPATTDLTLDLSGITFIDSAGFRALLGLASNMPERRLVLSRPSAAARKILDVLHAESLPGISVEQ